MIKNTDNQIDQRFDLLESRITRLEQLMYVLLVTSIPTVLKFFGV